jgi:hypothetical protein
VPHDRIATFDQDGTLWVEHPLHAQAIFALNRLAALVTQHPKAHEPFCSVLPQNVAAMAKFTEQHWMQIVAATHAGMSVPTPSLPTSRCTK